MVAGWASINESVEGPPIYDLLSRYIENHKVIDIPDNPNIKVTGA
jgi:sulfur-oxidizing protein SoxB